MFITSFIVLLLLNCCFHIWINNSFYKLPKSFVKQRHFIESPLLFYYFSLVWFFLFNRIHIFITQNFVFSALKTITVDLVPQFAKLLKRKNNELYELKPYHRSSTLHHLTKSNLSSNFLLTVSLATSHTAVFSYVDLSNNAPSTNDPFTNVSFSTIPSSTFCWATFSLPGLQYVNHKKYE